MEQERLARDTLVVILGGGQGERLYPLTRDRAKPAVPFGGTYRIIDFALSNCLNSGLRRIYCLTQYKSISLDRHLRLTWNCFNEEIGEFVVPMPPQQRMGVRWYLGTADAIYQNIYTLESDRPKHVLILAGDHIYKMNYLEMLRSHVRSGAQITVACIEVPIEDGKRFGVMTVDKDRRVVGFEEKPEKPAPIPGKKDRCLASMGIYVFDTTTLVQLVSEDAKHDGSHDFGKDILPRVIGERPVYGYPFKDENRKNLLYWRDIGTIEAYWQANMDLLDVDPVCNLYDQNWPVRTYMHQYPPAKFVFSEPGGRTGTAVNSIVSSGCIIAGAKVERSVLSPGVRVERGAEVSECIVFDEVVIGAGCRLRRTIVDKGVVIPPGAHVGLYPEVDRRKFTVSDTGIVVVPKDVPSGAEFWIR